MSRAALSIRVFGFYLGLAGTALFAVPNSVLPLLGLQTTTEVWVGLVGLLTFILGFYFLYSVRYQDVSFFRATVVARLIFFTGVTLLVLRADASPRLLAFGLVDLAGATWTWLALRR
jgi:hypothetical protein